MSFPAKFPGICRGCGERIDVGVLIVWKADKGAWHDGCEPQPPLADFSSIDRIAQASLAAFLAAGGTLPENPDNTGESATAKAGRETNAAAGHFWSKKRSFYGKGFTEPA